jgi:hypothetical protein
MKNFVLITFFTGVMLITSSFNSMLTGIAQHETWRIITSSISIALTAVMWIINDYPLFGSSGIPRLFQCGNY